MNKTLFSSAISLILAMSLWAVGSRLAEVPADSSPMAYGFLIADKSGRDVGLYSFPESDSSDMSDPSSHDDDNIIISKEKTSQLKKWLDR